MCIILKICQNGSAACGLSHKKSIARIGFPVSFISKWFLINTGGQTHFLAKTNSTTIGLKAEGNRKGTIEIYLFILTQDPTLVGVYSMAKLSNSTILSRNKNTRIEKYRWHYMAGGMRDNERDGSCLVSHWDILSQVMGYLNQYYLLCLITSKQGKIL